MIRLDPSLGEIPYETCICKNSRSPSIYLANNNGEIMHLSIPNLWLNGWKFATFCINNPFAMLIKSFNIQPQRAFCVTLQCAALFHAWKSVLSFLATHVRVSLRLSKCNDWWCRPRQMTVDHRCTTHSHHRLLQRLILELIYTDKLENF